MCAERPRHQLARPSSLPYSGRSRCPPSPPLPLCTQIKESPYNVLAGTGFFSDHLAQHKEPPSARNNVDLLASRHSNSLAEVARSTAREDGASAHNSSDATSKAVAPYELLASDTASAAPPEATRYTVRGGYLPSAACSPSFAAAQRARAAERTAAQIFEVRRRAAERGRSIGHALAGDDDEANPRGGDLSPRMAYNASIAAAADALATRDSMMGLPPRVLMERHRAAADAATAAAEAAALRRRGSGANGSVPADVATPNRPRGLGGRRARVGSRLDASTPA